MDPLYPGLSYKQRCNSFIYSLTDFFTKKIILRISIIYISHNMENFKTVGFQHISNLFNGGADLPSPKVFFDSGSPEQLGLTDQV